MSLIVSSIAEREQVSHLSFFSHFVLILRNHDFFECVTTLVKNFLGSSFYNLQGNS